MHKAREAEVQSDLNFIKKSMMAMQAESSLNVGIADLSASASVVQREYCSIGLDFTMFFWATGSLCSASGAPSNPSNPSMCLSILTPPPDSRGGLLRHPYYYDSGFPHIDKAYKGPYVEDMNFFIDPWGTGYIYQDNDNCTLDWKGDCQDSPARGNGVLRSAGPNRQFGDSDDVTQLVCSS